MRVQFKKEQHQWYAPVKCLPGLPLPCSPPVTASRLNKGKRQCRGAEYVPFYRRKVLLIKAIYAAATGVGGAVAGSGHIQEFCPLLSNVIFMSRDGALWL